MISYLNQISSLPSLLRHPQATREEIVAFQNRQLRRLVAHAYHNVPYYRRLFDRSGLKPQDIQSVADLPAIPITSRNDLQALPPNEIVARGLDPMQLIDHKTSGASGTPLTIRRTWFEERLLGLLRLRALHSFGLRISDKQAKILLVRPANPRDNQLLLRMLQKSGIYRTSYIHCLQSPEEILRALKRFLPDALTGFPGVLVRIAESFTEADRRVLRPRFVVAGGEVLTPLMRKQIREAFQAPVFETYASHEFSLIAWECQETGESHVCDDGMILEVIKDGRPAAPGERGEVVGTTLHSFAMPFVQYRLGDVVTQSSDTCACGQPFSTIRTIQGRMIDYFPLPSGRLMHPYEIVVPMNERAPWIRHYQLIQEREDLLVLRIVPCTTPSGREISLLETMVTSLLEPGVELRVLVVPEIPLEASGKFRVSRSFVRSGYDEIASSQL